MKRKKHDKTEKPNTHIYTAKERRDGSKKKEWEKNGTIHEIKSFGEKC